MTKGQKYTEVDALHAVDTALAKLEPDAQQRLIDWALSKYRLTADPTSRTKPPESAPSAGAGTLQPKDIKAFMALKRPANFYERVACLAYYLEKFESKNEIKTEDIRNANTDARLSRMTNPALFVKHATHTYGYLTSLGQRKFALSTRGEAIVQALPDRAKVEEALTSHPFGRKSRRKNKPKK